MSLPTPPKYRFLDAARTKELLDDFKGERTGWVQVEPKNWFFPYKYSEQGEGFFNFEGRPSDVWVMSYPRSGTTWTQELVWLVANDMDFSTANTTPLAERFPFLEFSMFHHPALTMEFLEYNRNDPKKRDFCTELTKPGYEVLAKMPSPRFIKTHFPLSLLPNVVNSGCKMIYVARNPKDVVVSWYELNQAFKTQGYVGDFVRFWRYFKNDLTAWSPYWEHVKEAWNNRDDGNFLFIFYEEMQQDLTSIIGRIAKFLGKRYELEEIAKLEDHLSVDSFRNNPMINSQELKDCGIVRKESAFVRNGVSGGWRDYFSEQLEIEADDWIEKNLENTDLRFPTTNNNWFQE